MPRERKLSSYPQDYWQFFQAALREEFVATLESQKDAKNLRFDLYGFRSAAKRQFELHPEDFGADLQKLIPQMSNVEIAVDGKHLIMRKKRRISQIESIKAQVS